MKTALIAIVGLIVAATLAARKYASVRDDLTKQQQAISEVWSEVDTVLQKRAEVVPSLVDAMKGLAKDQTPIFKEAEDARAALLNGHSPQEKIQANDRLDTALARLLLLSENYPRLKSSQSFKELEDEMDDADSHIPVARRKYNEALEHYNARIQQFPENVVASISGFARNDAYFKTGPGERTPVKAPL